MSGLCNFKEQNNKEITEVLQLIQDNKHNYNVDNKIKNIIYNRIKSIIDHDLWYTKDQILQIQNKIGDLYFLTKKQINALKESSLSINSDEDANEDGCPPGMSKYDWDEYLYRQDD